MFHVCWFEKKGAARIQHTLGSATTEDRAEELRRVYSKMGNIPLSQILIVKKPKHTRGGQR